MSKAAREFDRSWMIESGATEAQADNVLDDHSEVHQLMSDFITQ